MADPAPPRRCFQFRLRTLLIVVTLLAIVCAFVRWRYDFVWQRKAMMQRIVYVDHGQVEIGVDSVTLEEKKPLPWIRRLFGDLSITSIALPADTSAAERATIRALFPEAQLWAFKNSLSDTQAPFPDNPAQ